MYFGNLVGRRYYVELDGRHFLNRFGHNVISFVQYGDVNWKWGITNVLVEPTGPAMTLTKGVMDTGSYGQGIDGMSDADGQVHVDFMDPVSVMSLVNDPGVEPLAGEVRSRLERVLAAL